MATTRNPKQEGSNVFDCKPQTGLCPVGCNECFYNRPGAFYVPIDEPHMPTVEEVGDGIMRVNSGHDSNINRKQAIAETEQYKHRFFNTALPRLGFPAPVVFTANREEEEPMPKPLFKSFENLMFVRLRVSATNLAHIDKGVKWWTDLQIPVVLTFMAYYTKQPEHKDCYVWKQRHINSYWCPTPAFMAAVLAQERTIGGRLVTLCGGLDSYKCADCRNCETYYWQTMKRMRGD